MTKRVPKMPTKAQRKKASRTLRPAHGGELVSTQPRQSTELATDDARFGEVLALIEAARNRAYQAVNLELVSLYWQLGEHISRKLEKAEWGDGVVDELAATLVRRYPGMRGYTRRNLFRMRQFFEAYRGQEKVSALLAQLPWTHHLLILCRHRPQCGPLPPRSPGPGVRTPKRCTRS